LQNYGKHEAESGVSWAGSEDGQVGAEHSCSHTEPSEAIGSCSCRRLCLMAGLLAAKCHVFLEDF
jgi:hypothetical protein